MKRYLLDTNAASDFINKRGKVPLRVQEARTSGERIVTCIPVMAELHFGVEYSSSRDENLRILRKGLSKMTIWPFDRPAAVEFGRIAAELKRRGRQIPAIDIMIAAIAKVFGNCTIVTTDSDFRAIPGLDIEDWTK